MLKIVGIVALLIMVGPATAQEATVKRPEDLQWKASPVLPQGAFTAMLMGDPSKPGGVVVHRSKIPANYAIPPHSHTFDEVVTVLSGSVSFAIGPTFDQTKGQVVTPGTFVVVPANSPHYVWTGNEEAVFQVQYIGPANVTYVDPADDPRKK